MRLKFREQNSTFTKHTGMTECISLYSFEGKDYNKVSSQQLYSGLVYTKSCITIAFPCISKREQKHGTLFSLHET